jgi:hypothetical protein
MQFSKKPKEQPQPQPETLSRRFRRLHAESEQIACQLLEQRVAGDKAAHPGLPVQNQEMMIKKHRTCFCEVAQEIIATES